MDYLDGNLSDNEMNELLDFLATHPDLKEELEEISEVKLQSDDSIHFPGKESLKKESLLNDKKHHFDELCIARIEGDLNETEVKEFDQQVKENKELNKIYSLYKKTKLTPDLSIVFDEKHLVKRTRPTLFAEAYKKFTLYAASVILLIALSVNILTNTSNISSREIYNSDLSLSSNLKQTQSNEEVYTIPQNNETIINYKTRINNLSFNPKLKVNNEAMGPELKHISPTFAALTANPEPAQYALAGLDDRGFSSNTLNNAAESSYSRNLAALRDKNSQPKNSSFSLLDIADLGFQGINKLTGKDWELRRYYNQEGELTKLALKAESFAFSTNIKNQ
jgi:hypothetical protein